MASYIGVDVGTASVRTVLVDAKGSVLASSTHPITVFRDQTDSRVFEQSTANIWSAICTAVRSTITESQVAPERVKGLGFDATCSLAVCDADGKPVVITHSDQLGQYGDRNIILWADHRAENEARLINSTGSVVLDYVGGSMSLEMDLPKILWLKRHMSPTLFARSHFFDLPDYLTFRATGTRTRSACSLTCKCSFIPHVGWQEPFFRTIGLEDIVDRGYGQIGAETREQVLTAGLPVGQGLSPDAAKELGLVVGTPVGSALIDAYAGWLGTVAARSRDERGHLSPAPALEDSPRRLAAVAGTSTCYLLQRPEGVFVQGVWGPYRDAVFPGYWMTEGGQSATGQLIEHTLTTHPAYNEAVRRAEDAGKDVHAVLQDVLEEMRIDAGLENFTELTRHLHIYPDFRGNRSPLSDAHMRGSIVGLALDASIHDLARRYYATLESLALQTRHILQVISSVRSNTDPEWDSDRPVDDDNAQPIRAIHLSGGQAVNGGMMVQLIADACGLPVVLSDETNAGSVVLGAAMLGRYAAEVREGGSGNDKPGERLWEIMVEMTPSGRQIRPRENRRLKRVLDAKYRIFKESIEIQRKWRREVDDALI